MRKCDRKLQSSDETTELHACAQPRQVSQRDNARAWANCPPRSESRRARDDVMSQRAGCIPRRSGHKRGLTLLYVTEWIGTWAAWDGAAETYAGTEDL